MKMTCKEEDEMIKVRIRGNNDRYGLNFDAILDWFAPHIGIPVRHKKSMHNHIIEYCKNWFNVEISRKQLKRLCHSYKNKFPAKAVVILMAIYNMLQNYAITTGDQNALESYESMIKLTPEHNANAIRFFYGNVPALIIKEREKLESKAGNTGEWNKVLIDYLAHTQTALEDRFEGTAWQKNVHDGFPFPRFEKSDLPASKFGNREYLRDR